MWRGARRQRARPARWRPCHPPPRGSASRDRQLSSPWRGSDLASAGGTLAPQMLGADASRAQSCQVPGGCWRRWHTGEARGDAGGKFLWAPVVQVQQGLNPPWMPLGGEAKKSDSSLRPCIKASPRPLIWPKRSLRGFKLEEGCSLRPRVVQDMAANALPPALLHQLPACPGSA